MHWRRRASRLCWVFFPVRVSCRPLAAVLVNPKASSSSRYASSPVSLVTVEPWNSNLIWRSKSTRRGSFWQSPIRFLGQRGGESTETLGFPEDRRKHHAKMTESSGKSGLLQSPPVVGLLSWTLADNPALRQRLSQLGQARLGHARPGQVHLAQLLHPGQVPHPLF